eukprot:CAMPEP_0198255276 /NCGR_PEP_ID=MMETSP1447-20131203/5420_1 /TAXON_ID=420782 /ORGANISM="Chaetoceros dichaeta, Strain CCMP1751" /LENGTH=171 /DNA_ID=CAMNT_0043941601 /DNA_START=37 /DNA_END=549 /DNA_ORIENTATION=+
MKLSNAAKHLECINEDISTTLFRLTKGQQDKIKLLIRQIQSKDEENISLQRSLQAAEQLAHDANATLTSTQATLTSLIKELEGTSATLNSERASSQKMDLSLREQLNLSTAALAHREQTNTVQCNKSAHLKQDMDDLRGMVEKLEGGKEMLEVWELKVNVKNLELEKEGLE